MDEESTTKSITIELKVYMHCDACERKVRRVINKVEGDEEVLYRKYFSLIIRVRNDVWHLPLGVETVEVDREENKVTVTGDFDPEKVVKKIKKTGKKAEILVPEEDEEEGMGQEPYYYIPYYYEEPVPLYPDADDVSDEFRSYRPESWNFHYFDDENAQACIVM